MDIKENVIYPVNDEKRYLKDFQSFYYQMNSQADNITKIFPMNVIINIDNINELNDLITEKFSHYNNAGFTTKIQLQYDDHKRVYFNSWRNFCDYKWYVNKSIENITIRWEVMVKLPSYDIPQKHTLCVKMSDTIPPDEMIKLLLSDMVDDVAEFDKNAYPIFASLDYVDTVICEEVLNIVEKWIGTLKQTKDTKNRMILKMKMHKNKISDAIRYLSTLLMIIFVTIILNNFFDSLQINTVGDMKIETLKYLFMYIIFLSLSFFIFSKLFYILAKFLNHCLTNYGVCHIFNITNGDIKVQEEIHKKERNKIISIVFDLSFSVILNIICGIITNYIA